MKDYLDQDILLDHLWALPLPIEKEIQQQEKLLSYTKQSVRRKKVQQRLNYLYKLKEKKDLQDKIMNELIVRVSERLGAPMASLLSSSSIYGRYL